MDFLLCKQDKQIKDLLQPTEIILLSAMIYKYNHVNKKQQRIILITNLAIYNIGKSNFLNDIFSVFDSTVRLKRRIGFEIVLGITVSRYGYQFVLNISNQHDYRYSSTDKKDIIIETICDAYYCFHKKKMAFYFTDESTLIKYCTTKIDLRDKKSKLSQEKPIYLDPQDLRTKQNEKRDSEMSTSRKQSKEEVEQISIDNFYPIKVLGKGASGKVFLCQMKGKNELYAIKSMRKQNIIEQQQIQKTKTERKLMEQIKHPFLISLEYCFQNKQKLFYVMKFIRGGQLFQHLYKKKKRFSEELTKFYTAQIILALQYLHNKKYIYRDLKPENILINEDGYLTITDFGMSKYLSSGTKTYSIAGTPQYIAPQIILSSGHDKCVDWWALGIIVYEMLNCSVPFKHENQNILFNMIIQKQITFPETSNLTQDCQNFIKNLLIKNPNNRLGNQGTQKIKKHPWLSDIQWEQIFNKKVIPPYIPKLFSDLDVTYFGRQFTQQEPQFSYVQPNMLLVNKFDNEFQEMNFKTNFKTNNQK